jgi:hypothetical protein
MGLLHYKYRFECIHTGEANIKKKQITKKKQTKKQRGQQTLYQLLPPSAPVLIFFPQTHAILAG